MNTSPTGRRDALPPLAETLRAPRHYGRRLRERIGRRLDENPATRRATVGLLVVAGLGVLFLVYWLYLFLATPSVGELRAARYAQATIVYTADEQELTRYSTKNRNWVPLDSISEHVPHALISIEDQRFYQHQGVDLRRTAGAILQTAKGNVQGGSTITMQLARNAFSGFRDDFILTRKFKEWITAIHIEDLYGKDEILEMYLNTVPFMYNAFGIEAGAQTYFSKPAHDLDPIEAATLIAMLKGPAYYNPNRHPERARERRNVVLNQMQARGYLSDDEYAALREQETPLAFHRISYGSERAPYFTEHLRQRLQEWAEEAGYNLYTSGLRVHTTLDGKMQKAAEASVREMGDRLQGVAEREWGASFGSFWNANPDLLERFIRQSSRYRRRVEGGADADSVLARLQADAAFLDSLKAQRQRLEAGFVAVDPRDGQVRAWVGGRDFEQTKYDHVAQAKRQPGSTFKPFVYATALEEGFAPDDRVRDEVRTYQISERQTWSPQNFGGSSGRLMKVRDGLAYSKNTITARLMMEVGPEKVVDVAHRMGIESELDAVPSLALGTSPVHLLEMAGAYTTIADQGTHHAPQLITRIENSDGSVLATFDSETRRGLPASTAYTLLDMMRGVVDYGTGQRIRNTYGARGDLAGKTGTTQRGADGWFMLLHPHLVAGAWVGFSTSALHFRSQYWGQGSHTALPIVGRFLQQVDLPEATFAPPPGYDGPAQGHRTLGTRDSLESQSVADSLSRVARGDTTSAGDSLTTADSTTTTADSLNRSQTADTTAPPPPDTARAEAPPPQEDEPEPPEEETQREGNESGAADTTAASGAAEN